MVLVCGLVAARVLPIPAILPFLIVSSLGNRFSSSSAHVEVDAKGGLELDGKPVEDIRDVWLQDDGVDPRAVVTHGAGRQLLVLWFVNHGQAKRFASAFPDKKELVAGYRPRLVDLIGSLRFVAIAGAFFALGSYYGAFALVFVPLQLRGFLTAKQLVVQGDSFELRTAFSSETYLRDLIVNVDVDEGIIQLKGADELRFAVPHSRDRLLNAPMWTDELRRRTLKRLARRPG